MESVGGQCGSIRVGLHPGSALSPFLFRMVMDRLTDEVRQSLCGLFADDMVIYSVSRACGESLEGWRQTKDVEAETEAGGLLWGEQLRRERRNDEL